MEASLIPLVSDSSKEDSRTGTRTSMFLVAVFSHSGSSLPAKIRNMSPTGALVEAAVIPPVHSRVRLSRGRLAVDATVVWVAAGRCGVRFSSSVDVPQWLAPTSGRAQQEVDEVVRLVKSGAVLSTAQDAGSTRGEAARRDGAAEIASDLRRILSLLESLGDDLVKDELVVGRHGPALQNLDIAMQVITEVEAVIASRDLGVASNSRLDGLRRSAAEAAKG